MVNPNHLFKIYNVLDIRTKPIYDNLYSQLIDNLGIGEIPSETNITLGDVALALGPGKAWWCARLLPEDTKHDIISAVFPSMKRMSIHLQNKYAIDCLPIIEEYVTNQNAHVIQRISRLTDILSKYWTDKNADKNPACSMLSAVYFVSCSISSSSKLLDVSHYRAAMAGTFALVSCGRNNYNEESRSQIRDICKMFPPVRLEVISN